MLHVHVHDNSYFLCGIISLKSHIYYTVPACVDTYQITILMRE